MPPLSYSSASTLQECERRFSHYKLLRTPEDEDYEKSSALAIGSAFHWLLEKSKHEKPVSISADLAICVADPTIGLAEEDVPLVHAMVLRYLRLHKRMGLRVLAVEIEIRTEWFLGYVDAVMEDADGNFWIVDLKTWKSVMPSTTQMLPKDVQLGLYAAHSALVAEQLGLLPEKFAGVRWRVATKSSAKQKKTESYIDFVKRLADDHIKAYDIPVPKDRLNGDERLAAHFKLWEKSAELRADPSKAAQNFKNCFSFFSPCAYWSKCHGQIFSEPVNLEITEE